MKPQSYISALANRIAKNIRNMSPEDTAEMAGKAIGYPITAVTMGASALVYNKIKDNKTKADIAKTRSIVIGGFDQDEQEKAQARFDEIIQLAPSVAQSKPFMQKMVSSRLHEGISAEDAQRLAELEARSKPMTVSLMPKLGSTTGVRPEVAGTICADAYLIVKTAAKLPSMQWLGDKMTGNTAKMLALFTIPGLSMAAAGGVAKSVSDSRDRKKLEAQLEKSFQKAMESSDGDKEPLKSNPDKARQAFQAMAHFAPHVAVQPDAARAFMSKIVAYDQGINVGDVRDLSEIEKNISSSSPSKPFLQGFSSTARSIGLGSAVTSATKSLADPYVDDYKATAEQAIAKDHQSRLF